jgi:phosphinothricin acetyltransferase
MYVHRDWRRRGVGDLLVRSSAKPNAWGCGNLLSRIFPFNEASRALCRKHGFREVGVYETCAPRWSLA